MLFSALRVAVFPTKLLLCSFLPVENGFLDFPLLIFTLLFFIFYVCLVPDKLFSYFSCFFVIGKRGFVFGFFGVMISWLLIVLFGNYCCFDRIVEILRSCILGIFMGARRKLFQKKNDWKGFSS